MQKLASSVLVIAVFALVACAGAHTNPERKRGDSWAACEPGIPSLALRVSVCCVTGDPGEIDKAIRTVTAADSYAFTVKGAQGVEAAYQKGMPLAMKADGIEFFRSGAIMVVKDGEIWRRTRTGTLSDPLRILGASAKVRDARPPHEELVKLQKHLKDALAADLARLVIITAKLDDAGAREAARTEDRDLARSGTVKLWIEQGKLTQYEIVIRVQGKRGNAEVAGEVKTSVIITGVGATKVDPPAAVLKALEQP
jgi:hypothetical protein